MLDNHWFGFPPVEGARMAWGARALFKPHTDYPLDILPDRQGIKRTEEDIPMFKGQFCPFIDNVVFPVMKDISNYFTGGSTERFAWHFEWPHDPAYLVVAQGTPNASYGYFYLAVSLVERDKAPVEEKPERYRTPEQKAADKIKADLEWAEFERKESERRRLERESSRVRNKRIREEVAAKLGNGPFKGPGEPLEVGDRVVTEANQGNRDAIVRAIAAGEALIEYFMRQGKSFYRIINKETQDVVQFSVSRSRIPKRFKLAA